MAPCRVVISATSLNLKQRRVSRSCAKPSAIPRAGSLSLSNRQGYRLPSLRNEDSTPALAKLAELESRPLTPVMLWPNVDGLDTDLPPALSLAAAKARRAAQMKPVGSADAVASAVEAAPTEVIISAEVKGKRCQSPSYSLLDCESDASRNHDPIDVRQSADKQPSCFSFTASSVCFHFHFHFLSLSLSLSSLFPPLIY